MTSGTGTIVVFELGDYCGSLDTRLDHWRPRLLSIGIGAIVYRLIILNIYEIPNLDQNLVSLFCLILRALVICTRLLQKILKIRGLKLR